MTTYSLVQTPRVNGTSGSYLGKYPHAHMKNRTAVVSESFVINGADMATASGASVSSSDVYEVFSIPAGAVIMAISYKVTTQEGGTCTFNLGDGGSATRFVSGGNGNTTTNSAYVTPYYYSAADTIDFALASGTLAAAVIEFCVVYAETKALAT